jgi:TRAP-type C4-dicarboxylate transport system permease large subunit
MMIATVPIVTPVVLAMGFDAVWFGVLMMLLLETALITPPVGLNLFVVQGVRSRGPIRDVMIGSAPFVVALLVMITALILWPEVALWLPHKIAQ